MYKLTTYTELELAHRLTHAYMGKCTAAHGHRYQVEITLASPDLNADRMVIDFKRLKEIVKEQLDDQWDHGFALYKDDPLVPAFEADAHNERFHILPENPTLEYMVKEWYHSIKKAIATLKAEHPEGIAPHARLVSIKASETARNTCEYSEDDEAVDALRSERDARRSERDARVERPKMEVDAAALAPKQASRDVMDGRTVKEKVAALCESTGAYPGVCKAELLNCGGDVASTEENIEYLKAQGLPGDAIPAAQISANAEEIQEIARPEVSAKAVPLNYELQDDEEAYLVAYLPQGYSHPVSGVFATATRGMGMHREFEAILKKRYPDGAIILGFNRIPR